MTTNLVAESNRNVLFLYSSGGQKSEIWQGRSPAGDTRGESGPGFWCCQCGIPELVTTSLQSLPVFTLPPPLCVRLKRPLPLS